MAMTGTDRTWLGGGALGAAALVALAWFAVISPELSTASALEEQTAAAQTQNTVLQTKVTKLRADFANMDGLTKSLQQARAGLPVDSGLADFTRQVATQAAAVGVTVASVTAAPPTAVTSGSGTPAPAKGKPSVAGQLFTIPVTLVTTGALDKQRALLSQLENDGPRRALVASTLFAPASGAVTASIDAATTMTTQLQVFVAPQTPAAQAELQKQLGGPS